MTCSYLVGPYEISFKSLALQFEKDLPEAHCALYCNFVTGFEIGRNFLQNESSQLVPFGTWQFGKISVLVNFIIQKLKSKHLVCLSFFKGRRENISHIFRA